MRTKILVLILTVFCEHAAGAAGIRILFGMTDTKETRWDGSLSVQGGHVAAIEPWRFENDDALIGDGGWKLTTHRIRLAFVPKPNFVANGVVVWLRDESNATNVAVVTTQGSFSLKLG